MEAWVAFFDSLSILGFTVALILVFQLSKDKIGSTPRLFLGLAIGLYLLVGISNLLEHLAITDYLDRYEDYLELLFLPFFMFFLFSLYMEQQFYKQKQVKDSLRQANLVVENSPVILFRWKAAEGWPVELVSNNVKQLGYMPDELLSGQVTYASIVHPDDLDRVVGEVQYFTTSNKDRFQQEYRIINKSGEERWVDDRTVVERNKKGQVTHYQGIVIDITERKQIREALFDEKERAQVTLDSIGDAVITTNHVGEIEYLNPVAEKLTGWTVEEAIGQPLGRVFQVINEQNRKPVPDPIELCLNEGRVIGLANQTVLLRRDGKEHAIDDSVAPIRNREGQVIGVVLVFHDVSEARRIERQMAYDASHDALTGLVNRREFENRLERVLKGARNRDVHHALCYLDLDQFKVINDAVGHVAGDELLKQVSRLLSGLFRHRDTLARLGGDEFGLLLENCPLEKAVEAANKIIDRLTNFQFKWEGQSFKVGVSIGVVPINARSESMIQVLSEADIACYTAKDLGRGRFHIYQADDSETAQRHGEILQAVQLRDAIEKDLFQLYCQPIISLMGNNSHIKYYELLLRLKGDDNQVILPNSFIPSAERYGLMTAIDRWVIRTALSACTRKFGNNGLRLSINLSGNSLNDATLLDYVRAQFNEFNVPPEWICFEITETATIQNLSKAQHFVQEMRSLGVQIALDDFGSGLSSFRYLKTLSIDFLKIDGSFVKDILESQSDKAMVAAIHQVGHTMGIYTIAEHVEQEEIVAQLQEMGVDYAQGYALGLPMPFESIL
jgi:diguanylate cyclase (GGDEF)-like protein/PAS domain S-box-containing protein